MTLNGELQTAVRFRLRRRAALAAVSLAAVVLSGCATTSPGGGMGGIELPDDVNAADVAFVEMMIPHHELAINMADTVLAKDGIEPAVIELATDIKAAQGPEIELMESWLADWGLPSMASSGGMDGMDHGGDGMTRDDDTEALADAAGADASRLFLEHMIEHHDGAVEMAQELLDDGENAEVRQLGEAIIAAQEAEIELMRELLG